MTKQDLVQEAAKSSGHSQLEIKEVAEQFMRLIGEQLSQEKTIEIRGFGTFYTKVRKPRPARNPRTGEICPLGRRKVALFRFSADMKTQIREVPELTEVLSQSLSGETAARNDSSSGRAEASVRELSAGADKHFLNDGR